MSARFAVCLQCDDQASVLSVVAAIVRVALVVGIRHCVVGVVVCLTVPLFARRRRIVAHVILRVLAFVTLTNTFSLLQVTATVRNISGRSSSSCPTSDRLLAVASSLVLVVIWSQLVGSHSLSAQETGTVLSTLPRFDLATTGGVLGSDISRRVAP